MQKIKDYRGIKKLGFIDKHEPLTSTRCSDSLPCDSAICALFEESRMVLEQQHYPKETDAPAPCALRIRETWAGLMGHY